MSPEMFPKSVVLHFPASVYQNFGASEMLPKLLETLKVEDLHCIQFLSSGKARVSFHEKTTRDHHLSQGFQFDGQDVPVTRHAEKVTTVYLHDPPMKLLAMTSLTSLGPSVTS